MNSTTKTMLFTILILGTVISVFTAATVIASTNNVTGGQHQRDQDREQNTNNNSYLDNGCSERHQYQRCSECSDCGNNAPVMNRIQYQYQHRYCWNQCN